jgi:molecular chaperone DnaK
LEEARRALTEGGVDKLNAAAETLTKASHRIAETMYKAQQSAASAGAGSAGTPGGQGQSSGDGKSSSGQGDVVDAEFVDVDDSKKPN